MPVGAIIGLVIAFILVAVAATLVGTLVVRVLALRHQFGPEYDRLVREAGPRRAHAELTERRRRVDRLGIRPLTAAQRARYAGEWISAQERFVDSPAQAAGAAAALVTAVAADRGYPAADQAQLLTDLSVHHARRLDGYRRARQTSERGGRAPTEELRQALLAYRALFRELLGPAPAGGATRAVIPGRAAAAGRGTTQEAAAPAARGAGKEWAK